MFLLCVCVCVMLSLLIHSKMGGGLLSVLVHTLTANAEDLSRKTVDCLTGETITETFREEKQEAGRLLGKLLSISALLGKHISICAATRD